MSNNNGKFFIMKILKFFIVLDFIQLCLCMHTNMTICNDAGKSLRSKRQLPEYTRWKSNIASKPEFIVKVDDDAFNPSAVTSSQIVAINIQPVTKAREKIIIGGAAPIEERSILQEVPAEYTRFVIPPTTTAKDSDVIPPPQTRNAQAPVAPFTTARPMADDMVRPLRPQFVSRIPPTAQQYAPIAPVAFHRAPVTPSAVSPTKLFPPSRSPIPPGLSTPHRSPIPPQPVMESNGFGGPQPIDDDKDEFEEYFVTLEMHSEKVTRTSSPDFMTTPQTFDEELEGIPTKTTTVNDLDAFQMMFYNDEDNEIGDSRRKTAEAPEDTGKSDRDLEEKPFDDDEISGPLMKEKPSKDNEINGKLMKEKPSVDEGKQDENIKENGFNDSEGEDDSVHKYINENQVRDKGLKPTRKLYTAPSVKTSQNYSLNVTVLSLGTDKPTTQMPRMPQKCSLLKIKQLTFSAPRTLHEIVSQLKQWSERSPIATVVDITANNLTTMDNPICMMKVDDPSSGQVVSAKDIVMIVAGIQGRDHHAVTAAMYVLYQLIERTEAHSDLLTRYRFWIIPVFNPDGYDYSLTFAQRREWSKNLRQSWEECDGHPGCKDCERYGLRCTPTPCYGVNLDRNFEYQWIPADELKTEHPCGELYAGKRQLSERETLALTTFLHEQKTPISMFVAFKEGDVLGVMYPYSHTRKRRAFDQVYRKRASRAASAAFSISGRPYVAGQTSEFLPLYAGGIEDWVDGHLGIDNTYTIMMFRPSDSYNSKLMTENVVHEAYAALDTLLLEPGQVIGNEVQLLRTTGRTSKTVPVPILVLSAAVFIFNS